MADRNERESSTSSGRRDFILPQPAVFALYVLLVAACLIVMFIEPTMREGAFVGLVFALATFPMAIRAGANADAPNPRESFDKIAKAIERLTQEGGLSETAKRILHRKEERRLLRAAIEQDIHDKDYDAALILVRELADRFGYRVDAEEFRERIERARAQNIDREVLQAIENLESMLRERNWSDAFAEAARIQRLFPESHRVQRLRERVEDAKGRYKVDLERRFLLCAQREQIDDAMKLLKELDHYLTEQEAEPFREVARGVIGKARDNLGVRFKLAVQDRAWVDAVDVGERIVAEFPNSQMAAEVREMLDALRERAAQLRNPGQRVNA
ncbi:MAG: hypothetical protein ACTS27_07650 [Phycisphaerales bacterium]